MDSPELQASVDYLASAEALASLKRDLYWPKWHSPWWHALLLHEMGLVKLVPEPIVEALVNGLAHFPCKIFPIQESDLPVGLDPVRETQCHCALGNIYQVLAAWGVDVDREIDWIRPWFLRYQMDDGGLNCDNFAYRIEDECPSSMVATIAPFEAILRYTPRPWTAQEEAFLSRAAGFLMQRQLRLGSATRHNAEERQTAPCWGRLCFPRFYLYDVLRGLTALLEWARKTRQVVPQDCLEPVLTDLRQQYPEGVLWPRRQSYSGIGTRLLGSQGSWVKAPALTFPLLESVSQLNTPSPFLTAQWRAALAT